MRKRLIAGIVIAAALIAAIIVFVSLRPLAKPSITVGGIRYRMEGVTYGTNHHFATGFPLFSALRRVLPQSWQRLLPAEIKYDNQTTEPEALVYLSAYDVAKGQYVSPTWDYFRTLDEHGCVFYVNSWSSATPGSPTFSVSTVHLRSFPRRAASFKLRAYQPGGNAIELSVPNPTRGPFSSWTPESIPARRVADGLTYELTAFNTGRYWGKGGTYHGQPVYTVLHEGKNVTKEFGPITELLDATGNRSSSLCPYEPAWRLETKFLKNAKASFLPEQVWRIPSLRVPENGRMMMFNQTHTFSNAAVHLLAFIGAGMFRISNDVLVASTPWVSGMAIGTSSSTSMENGKTRRIEEYTADTPGLLISVTNLARIDDLLIRHRDQTGRIGESRTWSSTGNQFRFSLADLTNATTIDLEIIVQRPVRVEYTIAPPRPPVPKR